MSYKDMRLFSKQFDHTYSFVDLIGESMEGKVYKATVKNVSGYFAIKIFELDKLSNKSFKKLMKKLRKLEDFNSEFLNNFKEVIMSGSKINFVMNYFQFNLSNIISKLFPEGIKDFKLVKVILEQVAEGIYFLHNEGYIHRNITSSSIFFGKQGEIKLDYFLHIEKIKTHSKNKKRYGEICYMAPELLAEDFKGYSTEIDIWAFGILAHELITGHAPYWNIGSNDAIKKIVGEDFPCFDKSYIKFFKKDFLKLIESCLNKDSKLRPNISDVMYYFKSLSSTSSKDIINQMIMPRLEQFDQCKIKLSSI